MTKTKTTTGKPAHYAQLSDYDRALFDAGDFYNPNGTLRAVHQRLQHMWHEEYMRRGAAFARADEALRNHERDCKQCREGCCDTGGELQCMEFAAYSYLELHSHCRPACAGKMIYLETGEEV